MADFYHSKLLSRHAKCIHAVTTKTISKPLSGSLALHTGERKEAVLRNRYDAANRLGLGRGYHFIVADQTHSDNIRIITRKETLGWSSAEDAIENCDALITDQKGVALTVLTADCVPILILDTYKEIIAAVHAGWKGTGADIAGKTIRKMGEEFGSDPDDIAAFIAPSIGRCCYEVGGEVAGHFKDEETYDRKGEKYMLDLPLINRKQLLDAGVKSENIEMSGKCTSCEAERFFSYRKEQGCSGRFMSMIALKPYHQPG